MEKRIIKKTRLFQLQFKEDIKEWIINNSDVKENKELIEFIFKYPLLNLEEKDFQKRKRVKNIVPLFERCKALRAIGDQCTRRKGEGVDFCGTHIKGQPHGVVDTNSTQNEHSHCKKITIWQEEIQGIIYYIDEHFNVYNTNDILENKHSPPVIAKWERNKSGDIIIPQLFK